MMLRIALTGSLGLTLMLAGCGAGDPAVPVTGILTVSRGGGGEIFFPASGLRTSFTTSVTVAVRATTDTASQFTIYTLFGLSRLNFREIPTAALVTFVDGLSPTASANIELPSSIVRMALHTGFNTNLFIGGGDTLRPAAQDAPTVYEQTSGGTFVLEPKPSGVGFTAQDATDRRARFDTLTLTDLDTGATALLDGTVDYTLSTDIGQEFFGYVGDLGLLRRPPTSGGGPPAPPGTVGSGGGTGGGGGSSDDVPPSPPI